MNNVDRNTQNNIVWRYIKAHPGSTAKEVSTAIGIRHCGVSPCITMLYRAKALVGTHRTFINENARQQTVWQYEAIGDAPPDLRKKNKTAAKKVQQTIESLPTGTPVQEPTAAETGTLAEAQEFKLWLEFRKLKASGVL